MVGAFGFGNSDTEAQAYHSDSVSRPIFFRYTDTAFNGRRIDAYSELLGDFGKLSAACP